MGSTQTKDEQKTVDTTGQVNNNVVIQETVDVYSSEIVLLLSVIVVLKLIEFLCYVYMQHARKMKKKYSGNEKA